MNMLFPLLAVLIWSINAVVSKLSATAIDPAPSRSTAGCWR